MPFITLLNRLMACGALLMAGLCRAEGEATPKDTLRSKIDAAYPYPERSGPSTQVIYGDDDRVDVYLEGDPERVALAESVCALVSTGQLTAQGNGSFKLQTYTWTAGGVPACAEEPFGTQPIAPFCTGFLVAPDIIATAGHCFDPSDFAGTRFVFGYQMQNGQTATTIFDANQIYSGVALLGREQAGNGADYSIVRLDRAVTAPGARPLPIRREGSIALNTPIGVIGHPAGLPLKIAYGAETRVRNAGPTAFFVGNLDTYGGNSGSPVFNAITGVVEGILVRGATDYVTQGGCFVSNRLTNEAGGEDVTRATVFAGLIPAQGVSFDRNVYACGATIKLSLLDDNAPANEPLSALLTTGLGDSEAVTLQPYVAGEWRGTIRNTSGEAATLNDGMLQGLAQDTITATYYDADNGTGQAATQISTAAQDCVPPSIQNVQVRAVGANQFSVEFTTDEPAETQLEVGLACGAFALTAADSGKTTTHTLTISGLDPCQTYFFNLVATDRAGLTTRWDNDGACGLARTGEEIVLLEDNFDTVTQVAWTHSAQIGADNWAAGSGPFVQSPDSAYGTTGVVAGSTKTIDASLYTPALPGGGQLHFRQGYDLEETFDAAVLELSTDGGQNWSDLGDAILRGGYNQTISSSYDNPVGGRRAWSGIVESSEVSVDLSATAGQTILLRFRFAADSSVESPGWAIDDVRYVEFSACVEQPVTLLAPNGGETLAGESPITIDWHSELETAGSGVRFELWRAGARLMDLGYGWNPEGAGASVVYLPGVIAGNDYRMRVISTWDPTLYDESDADFSITGNALRVQWPNGGEVWQAQTQQWISWKTTAQIAGTAVRFELWNDAGKVAELGTGYDADGEDLTAGTVPMVTTGADYRVRLISAYDPALYDESDAPFTIQGSAPRNAVTPGGWELYR